MKPTSFETDTLADFVGQKHALLVQLRDLGRRQIESIDAGDIGQLLKILSAKQRLLAALQQIERGLDPFRNQDPERRTWRTADARRQCAQLAGNCEAILNEIMQQEKHSEEQMIMRRDEAASRLQGAHVAAEARGAYAMDAMSNLGQIDLSSQV
jgi:flagellar biosynthesis/type III secretory pathway chaperone